VEKIEITIAPGGDTTISVEGVKGKGCTDLTKAIEKALGKVVKDEKTSEYRERPRDARLQQKGG
jgi:hypothetical protein